MNGIMDDRNQGVKSSSDCASTTPESIDDETIIRLGVFTKDAIADMDEQLTEKEINDEVAAIVQELAIVGR